jgi:sialic acid synthase SpsE
MKANTNKTFIIAEAGVNHNGSLKKALELIDVAKLSAAIEKNFSK